MDETRFEHPIYSSVDGYIEHCRKGLQGAATSLFNKLDNELGGRVEVFAIDAAKKSKNEFVVAPAKDSVFNSLGAQIGDLISTLKGIDKKNPLFSFYTPDLVRGYLAQLETKARKISKVVFFSEPIIIGSFVVYASLWFPANAYNKHYRLEIPSGLVHSLIDAAVVQFLRHSYVFMLHSFAPKGASQAFFMDTDYLLRESGKSLLARVSTYLPQEDILQALGASIRSTTLFEDLSEISKMPYEGVKARGNLLICASHYPTPHHPSIDLLMPFKEPVWSYERRRVRKLLEIAHDDVSLLYHRGYIYGLVRKKDDYDTTTETLFDIEIIGHAKWRLKHGEEILMVVEYDKPSLGVEPKAIAFEQLKELLVAEFTSLTEERRESLLSLAKMAMEQQHGTMLVISDKASEEAERLEKQSVAIKPTTIDTQLMSLITAIDGAVLLDTQGQCCAVGVILDGTMEPGKGDPSRGARYNAAIKYLSYAQQQQHKVAIVVVSEDGTVNVLPEVKG